MMCKFTKVPDFKPCDSPLPTPPHTKKLQTFRKLVTNSKLIKSSLQNCLMCQSEMYLYLLCISHFMAKLQCRSKSSLKKIIHFTRSLNEAYNYFTTWLCEKISHIKVVGRNLTFKMIFTHGVCFALKFRINSILLSNASPCTVPGRPKYQLAAAPRYSLR